MVLLSIIIPVYNEAKTFDQMLSKVRAQNVPGVHKEIIIVEAASTDGTAAVVDKYRETKGIRVYHLKQYCGKGTKLQYGFKRARGDIILIQDADLEYDVRDYPKLIKPILQGKADFVLGSRHLGHKMKWQIRKYRGKDYLYAHIINVGSLFLNTFMNIMYGVWLTDPQTMYKVFRRSCLQGITFKEDGFHMDFEMVIKLIKAGYTPIEVPVSYNSRGYSEGKKIKIIETGLQDVKTILKYRFVD